MCFPFGHSLRTEHDDPRTFSISSCKPDTIISIAFEPTLASRYRVYPNSKVYQPSYLRFVHHHITSHHAHTMAPVVHRRKIRRQQSRRRSLTKSSSWPNPSESAQSEKTPAPASSTSTCSSRSDNDDGDDSAYIYDYKHHNAESDSESDSEAESESPEVESVESSAPVKVQDATGSIDCAQKKPTHIVKTSTPSASSSTSSSSTTTRGTSRSEQGTARHNNTSSSRPKTTTHINLPREKSDANVKPKNKSLRTTDTDAMAAIIANLQRELEDARTTISKFKSQASKQDRTIQFLYSCNERMKHFEMDASRHHGRAIRELSDKNATLADKNRRLELENHQLRECCEIIMKSKAKEEAKSTPKSTTSKARPSTDRANSGATRSTAASSTFFHEAQEGGLPPFPVVVPASSNRNGEEDLHPAAAAAAANIAATTARRRFSLLAAGVRDLPRRMLQAPPPPERSLAERYSIGGGSPQHYRMPPVNSTRRRNSAGGGPAHNGHGSGTSSEYPDEQLLFLHNSREDQRQQPHRHPPHRYSEPAGQIQAPFPLQGDYLMDEQQIPPYDSDEEEEDDSIVGATLVCKGIGWRSNSFREPRRSDSNNNRRPRRRASMF